MNKARKGRGGKKERREKGSGKGKREVSYPGASLPNTSVREIPFLLPKDQISWGEVAVYSKALLFKVWA